MYALASGLTSGGLFTPGACGFALGAITMAALTVWFKTKLNIVYVFAHEMTHALFCLLTFSRIHKISVTSHGGFVEHSDANMLITLSPYCFPFYLMIALLLRLLTETLLPGIIPWPLWCALFGLCTTFHAIFTFDALVSVAQPDTEPYGRLFSYVLITELNLFFALLAAALTGLISYSGAATALLGFTADTYLFIWDVLTAVCAKISTVF